MFIYFKEGNLEILAIATDKTSRVEGALVLETNTYKDINMLKIELDELGEYKLIELEEEENRIDEVTGLTLTEKVSILEVENASILKDSAVKDLLIESLQTDIADILKSMAQV